MMKRNEFHWRVNAWNNDTVYSRLSIVTFLTPFYRTEVSKFIASPIAKMQQLIDLPRIVTPVFKLRCVAALDQPRSFAEA